MIKALIFDCFGVLATDIWLEFCNSLPPEVDTTEASAMNRAYDKGIISIEDFRQGVYSLTGKYPPDLGDMHTNEMGKNLGLLTLIAQLKDDYKIGLLSNVSTDWVTSEFLTEHEQKSFDTIVLSYQVDMIKPDPRIYQLVCERLGVLPEEAVMIDDRLMYVDGAKDAGLDGLTYTDLRRFTQELNTLLNTNY